MVIIYYSLIHLAWLPWWLSSKEYTCQCRRHRRPWFNSIPGQKDPLEKEMATHFSILAWEIPWSEEPGGLQSMGSERVGRHLATKQQLHICDA